MVRNPDQTLKIFSILENASFINLETCSVKELKGGLTNQVYLVKDQGKLYTLRLFGKGTGDFINRSVELEALEFFGSMNLAPRPLIKCPNQTFLLSTFAEGRQLDHKDFFKKGILKEFIHNLKRVHHSKLELNSEICPLGRIKDLIKVLETRSPDHVKLKKIRKIYAQLESVFNSLELSEEEKIPCHLDLGPQNVIYNKENEEMSFIDWEYSSMAPLSFELSNIFFELQVPYAQEKNILRSYFGKNDVAEEYNRISSLRPFVTFYWYVWSVLQALNSSIDSDFKALGKFYLNATQSWLSFIEAEILEDVVI